MTIFFKNKNLPVSSSLFFENNNTPNLIKDSLKNKLINEDLQISKNTIQMKIVNFLINNYLIILFSSIIFSLLVWRYKIVKDRKKNRIIDDD